VAQASVQRVRVCACCMEGVRSVAAEVDERVFRCTAQTSTYLQPPPRVVVFDYDRTLTLETYNSIIRDYVSGWRTQIDPWRVVNNSPGSGWDSYDGSFTAEGITSEELKQEFTRGKHTAGAYSQLCMQDFLRVSFNGVERKAAAVPRKEFLSSEVHNPHKRLYHLKRLLDSIRISLDQQVPPGKLIIMTYNADGAIFVLNTLIHAELSQYFDAVHSALNSVENIGGAWSVVHKDSERLPPDASTGLPATSSAAADFYHQAKVRSQPTFQRLRTVSIQEVVVEGNDVGRIYVHSGGRIKHDKFGKADGVEHYYKDYGGLSCACLVDDDPENAVAWIERGGPYLVDLSQIASAEKLTEAYIAQAALWFEAVMRPRTSLDVPAPPATVVE